MNLPAAIHSKHLVQCVYHGFVRVVEPHTYGIDTAGNECLCAFQIAGGSQSGETGWKTFRVRDMQSLTVLPNKFHAARPDYRRDDGGFAVIHAQL